MSYSWKSKDYNMKVHWRRLETNLRRMRFDRCPAIPQDFDEYISHLADVAREQADYAAGKLATTKTETAINERLERQPIVPFESIRRFRDPRLGVMGYKTIWAHSWIEEKDHPVAHWPDAQELKEEGDERHTSNFGRCMPMLRCPGNETVNWKQLPELTMYPFDQVMHVPRKCAVVNPKMPGFVLEVDEDGIPYDDDDMPGGSVALAYHLDHANENVENTTPIKIWQTQFFFQFFAAQIHGYKDVVLYNNSSHEDTPKIEDHTEKATARMENTMQEGKIQKSKKKATFSFNPKAAAFVSVNDSPPSSDGGSSPNEESFENPISSMKDVLTIISHIEKVAESLKTNYDEAHQYILSNDTSNDTSNDISNDTSNATSATPALTTGLTAPEPNEMESESTRRILDFVLPIGNYQTHRTGSYGAIGSERRSSSSTDNQPLTDDESDMDGGVSLHASRFSSLVPRCNSADISPKTIPKSYIYADEEPATLADLVAASEPDTF